MEIDRQTIKALSADTRIDILKCLADRRKMPSELSKELNLATSTVTEHLRNLEGADLIAKKETGHKWIYYELTIKGRSLVKPKFPVQFFVLISLGILLAFSGYANLYLADSYEFGNAPATTSGLPDAAEAGKSLNEEIPAQAPVKNLNYISLALLIIGLLVTVSGLVLTAGRLLKRQQSQLYAAYLF